MKPEKGSKIGREKIIWTKAPFKKLNRICILYKVIERRGSLIARSTFHNPKLVVCDFPWFWPFFCAIMEWCKILKKNMGTDCWPHPTHGTNTVQKSMTWICPPWNFHLHQKKQPKISTLKFSTLMSKWPFFFGMSNKWPRNQRLLLVTSNWEMLTIIMISRILPDDFFSTILEGLKQPTNQAAHFILPTQAIKALWFSWKIPPNFTRYICIKNLIPPKK